MAAMFTSGKLIKLLTRALIRKDQFFPAMADSLGDVHRSEIATVDVFILFVHLSATLIFCPGNDFVLNRFSDLYPILRKTCHSDQ